MGDTSTLGSNLTCGEPPDPWGTSRPMGDILTLGGHPDPLGTPQPLGDTVTWWLYPNPNSWGCDDALGWVPMGPSLSLRHQHLPQPHITVGDGGAGEVLGNFYPSLG